MKKNIWVVVPLSVLMNNSIEAKTINTSLATQKTAEYYQQLIKQQPQNLAELALFTNLMPKGADLHHHYSGSIYAETYLDWVDAQGFCIYIVSTESKKLYSIEKNPKDIKGLDKVNCVSAASVRSHNEWYTGILKTWSDKDYSNHYHIQPPPDQQFFNTFGYFGEVSSYKFNQGLQHLKQRAKEENVSYIETMLTSSPTLELSDIAALLTKINAQSTDDEQAILIEQALVLLRANNDLNKEINNYLNIINNAAVGLDDDQFTLRFQTYVSRNNQPAKVLSGLYSAFVAVSKNPHLVAVNIVGPENGYVAMRDYALHMQMFKVLKKQFPNVKLTLHAGELALGMVPPEGLKSHIHDAIKVAGAQRIGHGIDIAHEHEPIHLLDLMNKNDIAVEINLTSNAFILGIKPNEHPIQLYQKFKVPYVISTDDSGVSRNNLSYEYLLYTSNYQPSYQSLKDTVYRSIQYSFLNEVEKQREIQKLNQRFLTFEQKIASIP